MYTHRFDFKAPEARGDVDGNMDPLYETKLFKGAGFLDCLLQAEEYAARCAIDWHDDVLVLSPDDPPLDNENMWCTTVVTLKEALE